MLTKFKEYFPCCWQDMVVLIVVMASALDICLLLKSSEGNGLHVPLVFVLAVLIVSGCTTGYLYGISASVISIFGVVFVLSTNYSYKIWLTGYPLTLLTLFSVSIVTCTFTTKTRSQERIRLDVEREKMRANLLRGIGHDLRTPLTSIIAVTNLMLEDENTLTQEQNHELLSNIQDEAQWLIRMVENLLSITRFDSGAAVKRTPAAAEELIGEVAMKFQKRFPQVRVDAVSPPELLMVSVDVVLIEQVLFNLMENAVLHGDANDITLCVSPHGRQVLFQVEDNGRGIDEALLPHLFEDYVYQITQESSHDMKQNLGIGLSVCMAILKAHGSVLQALNKPQGGAVFRFILS